MPPTRTFEQEYQERRDPRQKQMKATRSKCSSAIETKIQELIADKKEGLTLPAELIVKGVDAGVLEVSWPTDGDEEINAAEDEEPEYLKIDITWDSGAGGSVLDKMDAPGRAVTESRGSRVGACFVAAGGGRIDKEIARVLREGMLYRSPGAACA